MNLIAIETVTESCSVAVCYKGEIHQKSCSERIGHSNLVLGMVSGLCDELGVTLSDMDIIAVDVGPGSFTGVRIGIGVAQGLAYGADLPVMGVGSLEALSASLQNTLVLPALDARMGQVYCALYDVTMGTKEIMAPVVCAPSQIPWFDQQRDFVGLGSGWDQYYDEMLTSVSRAPNQPLPIQWQPGQFPEAKFVTKIAIERGKTAAVSPLDLFASYVRNQVVSTATK